jgi:transketolase|tara:strand:- start:134 stop:886 length:753 start_codon:yes stop_codon:yes gene_type:complete
MDYKKLIKKAKKLRQETFLMFIKKDEAHLGGSFSMIETLITLYELIMKKNDKFILSKAHASFPLCILLRQKGLNPKMSTHLEIDEKNGINCTTGSLGHGLPIATGMAFAKKKLKKPGKIYVMISDGECQEGTTWESLLIASKHKLDNLIVLIDYNKIQALSRLRDALPLSNLSSKFKAFNWECLEAKDGHSFKSLISTFKKKKSKGKPLVIIINTIKGKGIKDFENDPVWHARKLQGKDIDLGKKKLGII